MPHQYCHFTLHGPHTIRVLHLRPASDLSAPIQCSLKAVSLDDYPKWQAHYTALSYSWDAQSPSCKVDCDNGSLLVTPNCDAAMRRLRDTRDEKILWIDSICIDQTEAGMKERNHQVALMGEIYKSAARVVVWLGESNSRVENAVKSLVHIAEATKGMGLHQRRESQQALRDRVRDMASRVTRASEDPLDPLFGCSWFHRMWTIQEVTLCFFDRAWVRCGSLEIPWAILIIGADALKSQGYKWGRWKAAMSTQRQLFAYLAGRRIEGAKVLFDNQPDPSDDLHNDPLMFSILINIRDKQATNPKDKIFALYGLLAELEIPFPSPDYALPIEDVYREAVIASIEYDKNLYILYHVPSDRRRASLASWVPDWAECGFEPDDPRYAVLRDRFAASGPGVPRWRFSEDRTRLILSGTIIDEVICHMDPLPDISRLTARNRGQATDETENPDIKAANFIEINKQCRTVLKTWIEMSQWADYPTGEDAKAALQRTLVNDQSENNAQASENDAFNKWYEAMQLSDLDMVERLLRKQGFGGEIPTLPGPREAALRAIRERVTDASLIMEMLQPDPMSFQSMVLAFSQKKCLFYTQNSYFGTAADPLPERIQPGDKIAAVSGLELPLLLRPVEEGYRLVTHVYVHGIMYGEAWPEREEELEEIVLV